MLRKVRRGLRLHSIAQMYQRFQCFPEPGGGGAFAAVNILSQAVEFANARSHAAQFAAHLPVLFEG